MEKAALEKQTLVSELPQAVHPPPSAFSALVRVPYSSLRRLGGNTLWLLLARMGGQGLALLFTLLVARRMGGTGLGIYAAMTALVFLGNVATTFGLDTLIQRDVAARRDLRSLPAALKIQLGLSAAFAALAFWAAPVLLPESPGAIAALRLSGLALFPLALYTVCSAALRGCERMSAFLWLGLAPAALQLALGWLWLRPENLPAALAWLLLGGQLATALLAAAFCLAWVPGFRQAWRSPGIRVPALLKAGLPIALLGLMKVLYQRLPVILLAALAGAAATGWFSAALRLVEAAQIGHIAAVGALFPVMARLGPGDGSLARSSHPHARLMLLSGGMLLLLGAALAVFLALLAPQVVGWLFGPAFAPAVPALQLLAWTLIPYSFNLFASARLLAVGAERRVGVALGAGLLALALLGAAWTPPLELRGLCLALLAAEAVQAGVFILLTLRRRP